MPVAAPPTTVTVGNPDVYEGLAVFPLFGELTFDRRFLSFAEGIERGVTVGELPGGARVEELEVRNPLELPVLLYEGEEVQGASQNRVFSTSALVPARSAFPVPVSCVEHGRWDSRPSPSSRSPHAAHPGLRRAMSAHVRCRLALGERAQAHQGAVWEDVRATSRRHGVRSPSDALRDVYTARRHRLHAYARAIELRDGQFGALAAIGGEFVVLDHVSEPTAWYRLKNALVLGYALDALDAPKADPPSRAAARDFVAKLWRAPRTHGAAIGLGETVHFDCGGIAGTGVSWDDELVSLTAFAVDPPALAMAG